MTVTIKDYETIVNELIVYMATNLQGEVTDYNPGSVVRTFAEALAYQLGVNSNIPDNVYQQIENAYNGAYVSTATGSDLDKVVEIVGITRNPAVKSEGEVTFFANPAPSSDITIPVGTQISTQPDDQGARIVFVTTTEATLIALTTSVDVPIQAQTAGVSGNVAMNRVTYLVNSIFGVTAINNALDIVGGSDRETDDALRARAQGAVEIVGNATAESLRLAVLSIAGVGSVQVNDLPLRTATAELHTYLTATPEYTLCQWLAVDDATLTITGTAGAAPFTFTRNTDFELDVTTNNIVWQIGGTNPDNGTTFTTNYTYNHLGEVDMIVAGLTIPMSPTTLSDVEDTIDVHKAAGVKVNVIEPSKVLVNVTTAVVAKTGYVAGDVKTAVIAALTSYLDTIGVGESVYRANLFEVIQNVDGVENSTISVPAADVSITNVQVARAGTILAP